mmetsp:Transcript_113567/g.169856  ORF Transcript_113567/g.169856 Transcript_113567/m.169856 type:complete len:389 (+) Transcript_113567:203-1369(+)
MTMDPQEEIRRLKSEVERLNDELKGRDNLITSLECQIRALLTEQSRATLNKLPDEGITRRAAPELEDLERPLKMSGSLQPPSRSNVEMQQPLAPQQRQQQQQRDTQLNSHRRRDEDDDERTPKMTTTKQVKVESAIVEGDEESEARGSSMSRPGIKGAGLKSSKGAIKALPRELSIANDDDDEVTKYSIDDGTPTFEMDKTEMRDAYNARGLYTGTVSRKQQMPHGKGTMEYHLAGRIYQGDWHMGHWHGKGIIRTAEGVYEGEVVNDLKEGIGVLYYHDGRQFQGTFKQDDPVKGTLTFPDKSKYIGDLHNGARHGKGTYYFSDGSVYEGESVMDRFEGKGKMTWTDGGWYEGEWSQGEIHGYGMEIRPDGSLRHHGLWRKGVPIRQ